MNSSEWTNLTDLLSLALRLEGEGQYNLAKIAHAKADSLSRRAVWEMLAKLESIPFADWCRMGRHEEFGVVSIKQQVSYFAAHELSHLPQIERLVR